LIALIDGEEIISLTLEIVGGRRNLDMSFDAEDFFYPGWAFKVPFNI